MQTEPVSSKSGPLKNNCEKPRLEMPSIERGRDADFMGQMHVYRSTFWNSHSNTVAKVVMSCLKHGGAERRQGREAIRDFL